MILKLLREAHMGRVIFRRDDKAGGIPVDAVDDTRPQFAVDAGKALPAVVEQRIDQRTVRVSRCWVYHQPLGLIDNNDVRVLVYHLQRDVLRNHIYRLRRGPGNGHGLAAGQPGILRQRAALRGDSPLLRQALKGGAAQPRLFRQPRIQTLSRILSRCLQRHRLHSASSCHAFHKGTHSRPPLKRRRKRYTYPPR